MIVCSCNVFSDSQVRSVLAAGEEGPRNVREVYGCLGCSPKCGRCARTIQGLMQEAMGCGADVRMEPEQACAMAMLD
ncbi:MAG: domain protein (2Fe-2S)-binding domain protein [Hyphomicrobiales bacterium]|nr:domain protein (2Fe-2S)-binding domain protein [Hyphomicrobiales bacterium]